MKNNALEYLKKGKSVIPLKSDKRPYLSEWREYQTRKPTESEIEDWWSRWPHANIGIVTGKVSGITVIDVDSGSGGTTDGLPPTLVAKTGNGGWHYYYQYEPGVTIGAGLRQGIDFRGDGGYVVAPPSITDYADKNGKKRGGKYEWSLLEEPQPFPTELFQINKTQKDWKKLLAGVPEGMRNQTAASVAGKLISSLPRSDWESVAWTLLLSWNKNNTPPGDEGELRRTFESILKKHVLGLPQEEEIKIVLMSEAARLQAKSERVMTGFAPIDEATKGLARGSSVVIAAPSGHGKTAFMVSWSYHFIQSGIPCLWFSYEENVADIWERFKLTGLKDNAPSLVPLDLADNKLNYIEQAIKIQKQTTPSFAVFIDQLSYLAPKVDENTDINRIQTNYALYLGKIADQLKIMAKEHQIFIIFAHQLGRSGEVAYSDMIKHAADKVIYIVRIPAKEENSTEEFSDKTMVMFKKNRPWGSRPRIPMTVKGGLFVKMEDELVKYATETLGWKQTNNFFE